MYDVRTEVSLPALHAEDVSQRQNQYCAALHQHLTGLVQETQQYREMFEESLLNWPLDQKLIDFEEERKNSNEKSDATMMTAKSEALSFRNRTNLESNECMTSESQQLLRKIRSEIMQLTASAVPPNLTRDLEAQIERKPKDRFKVMKDIHNETDLCEQLGRVEPQFDSRCLC